MTSPAYLTKPWRRKLVTGAGDRRDCHKPDTWQKTQRTRRRKRVESSFLL